MGLQVGATTMKEVAEQIEKYYDDKHVEIIVTRNNDGTWTIIFD